MGGTSTTLLMNCGSIDISESGHPNRMNFKGVLVRLDEPSSKAPNGAEGHRIYVSSELAKKRLNTLLGMGLNYEPDGLAMHNQRHKVGVISKAWIDGQDLWVQGTIWKHDFPEAERDLKRPGLGMSMELGDVDVEDQKADVWRLKDLCFLGGTILWKTKAAYHRTQAIAARADERSISMTKRKNTAGDQEIDIKQLVELAASAAADKTKNELAPTLTKLARAVNAAMTRLDALDIDLIAAGAKKAEEEKEEEEEKDEEACADPGIKAAKKKDEEDDDGDEDEDDEEEMDAETDKGSLEEMGPNTDDDAEGNDTPGNFGKGAKNKGNKTTSEDKVGKTVSHGVTSSACMKANKRLAAMVAELTASVRSLEAAQSKQKKQLKAAAEQTDRRSKVINASLDPTVAGLLTKSGLNPLQMQASNQVLTVGEVDALIANGIPDLSPVERMTMKNRLLQAGLMENGSVSR